ncbi:MAG: hypothetical protein SHS37scaffold537_24 [Phage 68_12]|nr:MAG: hypothetical protein SHS37scaffold537_24 [Phage 68_12]
MTTNVAYLPGTVPTWTFAERVRKVRRDQGLTQAAFADQLDVGEKAYAAWESGKNEPGSLVDVAVKLEQTTGVPRQWFLGWLDEPTSPTDGGERARQDSNLRPRDYKGEGRVLELPRLSPAIAVAA